MNNHDFSRALQTETTRATKAAGIEIPLRLTALNSTRNLYFIESTERVVREYVKGCCAYDAKAKWLQNQIRRRHPGGKGESRYRMSRPHAKRRAVRNPQPQPIIGDMLSHIQFTTRISCDSDEPDRIILCFDGDIFVCADAKMTNIGHISAYVIQRGRAMNEGVDLCDAMDARSSATEECFVALFDMKTHEWNDSVEEIYAGICENDVLFIESLELKKKYRGDGIGARVVRETIVTLGSNCGLVVCKPFPLQYSGWMAEENKARRERPDFEQKRLADFRKVQEFWERLGFQQLRGSEFYAFSPEWKEQPMRKIAFLQ